MATLYASVAVVRFCVPNAKLPIPIDLLPNVSPSRVAYPIPMLCEPCVFASKACVPRATL